MKKIGFKYFIHAFFYFMLGALLIGQPWKEQRMPHSLAHEICLSQDLDLEAIVNDTKRQIYTVHCKPH